MPQVGIRTPHTLGKAALIKGDIKIMHIKLLFSDFIRS